MVISSPQSDLEARFAHILQPIRDLTKNWDVDIANHLEEYLDEIESISVTFDGGATTMNFSEAALVIQGSASVYSRKVEYLYTLVYQVLDLLASKKRQTQASSVDADGNDRDANFPPDADEEFLTLDDVKVHKNINMKSDGEDPTQGVHPIPRTPMSLIPLDDGEKGKNPLLSKTGELLGSRNDFKMNTCNIHQTGAMLLDMSHLNLLDGSMQAKTSTPIAALNIHNKGTEIVPQEVDVNQNACDEDFPQDVSMDDNNVEMPFDDAGETADNNNDVLKEQVHETLPLALRRSERKKEHIAEKKNVPEINYWEPLDPHCSENLTEKPAKKGRPFRIPAPLQTNKKKRKKTPEKQPLVPISQFITTAFYSHSSKFPKNPLKVPSFPELEKMYWEEFRRRQSFHKKERKVLVEEGRYEELAEEEQQDEPEENADINIPSPDDDQDDGGDGGFECEDLPISDEMLSTREDKVSLSFQSQGSQGLMVSSYEELVRHHVEGFLASAQQYAQITELAKRVTEWEDKIGPKLQEEDTHPPFDIHQYGTNVLDHMGNTKRIPFRHIASGKKVYEVCRLFLATLQLANNYNVKIECEGKLEEGMDKMELELLSTKRIYEELADYKAPSAS
ncbi:condensin-2 complex subunit H2-like [Liolophura sinensis]|uniref:condensin-2 complex subunit H2-like n=1 Tax=Liolophura sinensis TaxID=3198878 RepID=UPI003158B3C6